jgi:hypothetical protein
LNFVLSRDPLPEVTSNWRSGEAFPGKLVSLCLRGRREGAEGGAGR